MAHALGCDHGRGVLGVSYRNAGLGNSGCFSADAGVRVTAQDSAGRERLLRYCARPLFAGERLVWAGGKHWVLSDTNYRQDGVNLNFQQALRRGQ